MTRRLTFLRAEWRHLLMVTDEAPRDELVPLVPHGTELDTFEGRTLVRVVGVRFLRTRSAKASW